jgi:hypothetical protein
MSTHTKTFSTGFGQGLSTLADAFTNGSGRKLLGLKAENYASRNMATQLLAAQKQFDLDQNQKAMAGIAERIVQNPNDQSLLNMQMGMQFGQPNAMAQAFGNYAKETDRQTGLEGLGGQTANMGYFDKTTGLPVNTNVSDLARVNPNWSQIGSGSVAPSQIEANQALKEDRTASKNLTQNQLTQVQKLQKSLKGKVYAVKDDVGQVIAQIPLDTIPADKLAKILSTNPDVQRSVFSAKKAEWDMKTSQHKETWERSTLSDRIDKSFWETQTAETVSTLKDLELDLKQSTFEDTRKKAMYEAYEAKAKAFIKRVEAEKGKVMNFERLDNGDLVARGTKNDGSPFQMTVPLGNVKRIPKTKIVLSGPDNTEISQFLPGSGVDGVGTLKNIGDRGGASRKERINLAKKSLVKMVDIINTNPEAITGGKGFLKQLEEFSMNLLNIPATNKKGERIDYHAQFQNEGNRVLLLLAPFLLNSSGSKISDKDAERLKEANKLGSLGTNIEEVRETVGAMIRGLKAAQAGDEENPFSPSGQPQPDGGLSRNTMDQDLAFASKLSSNPEKIKMLLDNADKTGMTEQQKQILQTVLSEITQ